MPHLRGETADEDTVTRAQIEDRVGAFEDWAAVAAAAADAREGVSVDPHYRESEYRGPDEIQEGLEAEMMAFYAGRQYLVDNSKANRELGITHRPLREGLAEYLAWEADQLGLDIDINQAAIQ